MSSQLLLFPGRTASPVATTHTAPPTGPSAQIIALPRVASLRRCVIDAPQDGNAGRMVLSGRFSDVCAALDQMVANG